ncbi:DUF349 domain-containing protein [Agilicoccus flavus]|uniref:DUF349 domain-containing protein n=1 Tax=Agilicoccus flavus TaxID=2775968 RepID=UPI001CF710CC|nr:DUF349 domain-containing protein [Agilicoccus flavus]
MSDQSQPTPDAPAEVTAPQVEATDAVATPGTAPAPTDEARGAASEPADETGSTTPEPADETANAAPAPADETENAAPAPADETENAAPAPADETPAPADVTEPDTAGATEGAPGGDGTDGGSSEVPSPAPAPPAPPVPSPAPRPTPPASRPTPGPPARPGPARPAPGADRPAPPATAPVSGVAIADAVTFGRVADDGTVFVRTPEGESEVGSYPGASPDEALAYFARKYVEVDAAADLLLQRVTQTDLSAKEADESLAALRTSAGELRAVGDLVALAAKVENVATAVQARRAVEAEQRAQQRAEAAAAREKIVVEAERIAGQPEEKVQWKSSSARMRALLDEWKAAQRGGPRLDRETEQALWARLSSSRNSFDKMRRVHFAQLGATQGEAKAAKEALVAEAEALRDSTDWGATAGAFKRLMDRWRQAGRAARADDDALWSRFKAAQDAFFAAKDEIVAAENEEYQGNLVVKEELLAQAQALLPVTDLDRAKAALRSIQDKWDAAGRVPRSDMDRVEKAMRRVEQAVRDAEDHKWKATNPEVAARAASLAAQAEAALEKYRRDLEKAEKSGDERRIAKAREALETRQAWLAQAQAGMAEFGGR